MEVCGRYPVEGFFSLEAGKRARASHRPLLRCVVGETVPNASAEDMFIRICSYLDTLVQIVRPKRLLYIAIDGVAPRA